MSIERIDLDRLEDRMVDRQDELLTAIGTLHNSFERLRSDMNGQFRAQGLVNGKVGADIATLQERSTNDPLARWVAGIGTLIGGIAALLGLRG